jgi:hypothetical protein
VFVGHSVSRVRLRLVPHDLRGLPERVRMSYVGLRLVGGLILGGKQRGYSMWPFDVRRPVESALTQSNGLVRSDVEVFPLGLMEGKLKSSAFLSKKRGSQSFPNLMFIERPI